jgi:hypothetical protein
VVRKETARLEKVKRFELERKEKDKTFNEPRLQTFLKTQFCGHSTIFQTHTQTRALHSDTVWQYDAAAQCHR